MLIKFLNTLDANSRLYEYSQSLLEFCHNNPSIVRLKQPAYAKLNEKEVLGSANCDFILTTGDNSITLNHTVTEAINLFKE